MATLDFADRRLGLYAGRQALALTPAPSSPGGTDAGDDPRRVGRILVEEGLLDEARLAKALRIPSRLEKACA